MEVLAVVADVPLQVLRGHPMTAGMAEVLEWHRDIAWNHAGKTAHCGDCDAPLGPMSADMDEQSRWLRQHQAEELSAAGYGEVAPDGAGS